MGSAFVRPEARNDEKRVRELGLQNNLKLAEVNTLIDYYKRSDPDNDGLLPEQFEEAVGKFIASGLTIDPNLVFTIFDSGEGGIDGRVTMREFILGYAILCRGSTEGRLRYLFAIYSSVEGDGFLTRDQLKSSLMLMSRIAAQITEQTDDDENDEQDAEQQIETVADEMISASSDPNANGISYEDFLDQVKEVDVVTLWLDDLSSIAGEHLRDIERKELDIVELNMEREGILGSEPQLPWKNNSNYSPPATMQISGKTKRDESSTPSHSVDKKQKIPRPKKHKLVRRDIKAKLCAKQATAAKPGLDDDDDDDPGHYAAKPFIINYDQIVFGKILGRGGCATVYQCEWLHVPVAVKVFNDGYGEAASIEKLATADEEVRRTIVGDYVEEFWLLLQIRHPNCLLYMGICFEPVVCIVTELYSGGSVANFLHGPNPRKFTPEQALEMISGVARGMFYLHASSPPILHRDLKASNILINRSITHCVICDFGLSSQFVNEASGRSLHSRGQPARVGGIGTPYTMAPEVMSHQPYTPAADVFSYGVVMYEMYTGRSPFPKLQPIQLMFSVTEGKRPDFFPEDNVPPTLQNLIERCWAHNPDERPTFEEILTVLTSQQLEAEISVRQQATRFQPNAQGIEEKDGYEISKHLLEAVYRGKIDRVTELLDNGADVNYADYDKRTALHVASAEGKTECIELLLSKGAKLSVDRWGNSPLADARNYESRTRDSRPISLLEEVAGKSTGNVRDWQTAKVLDAVDEERLNYSAMIAAAEGDTTTLRQMLMNGVDANCTDYDQRTPLAVAASEGRSNVVELLIECGANIDKRDRWGSTAFHEAERGGYHDIIRLLHQARTSNHHPS